MIIVSICTTVKSKLIWFFFKPKELKPYKRLQSQGQGHVRTKWPSVVASLTLAENIQRSFLAVADPLLAPPRWPCG